MKKRAFGWAVLLGFSLAIGMGLGVALMPKAAVAAPPATARPASDLLLFLRLNGSPKYLGVITSAGASTTNASTAAPFTINAADTIEVSCDAAAFCIEGAAATNLAGATPGRPMGVLLPKQFVLKYQQQISGGLTATFACFGVGAFNCAVFTMQ